MNLSASFAVTEASQVAEARRVVLSLASKLEFPEERAGCAALVLTELATNLAKHARLGEIIMHPVCTPAGEPIAIEVLALDRGPGIPDVALSRRDGYSTAGTLGHGLGAIERLADSFEFYTHSTGTVIAARVSRQKSAGLRDGSRYDVGGVQVSMAGEPVCGDAWSWRMRPGRLALVVVDGLGHGVAAHEAAAVATSVFVNSHESTPARFIEDVHAALRPTRGAAVAFLAVDLERAVATYAGLGNIAGAILLASGRRHSMVSHNGTAGHSAVRIQEFNYPIAPESILIMCSDGLQTQWDLSPYPGIRTRSASIIAGVLYRDFSRRRDDVSVVVAKERPALPEV